MGSDPIFKNSMSGALLFWHFSSQIQCNGFQVNPNVISIKEGSSVTLKKGKNHGSEDFKVQVIFKRKER